MTRILAHPRSTTRNAFTMIELLVVVAIIAVLAAMLLPALKRAKDQAQSTACLNNLRQFGVACLLYRDDYRDWLPPISNGTGNIKDSEFPYRLRPYMGISIQKMELHSNDNPWVCPAETLRTDDGRWPVHPEGYWVGWGWGVRSRYNMNTLLGHDPGQTGIFKMRQQVKQPAVTVLYLDGKWSARADYSFPFWKARHAGRVNMVFVDGHTESHDVKELEGKYVGLGAAIKPFWNPEY